MYTRTNHPAKPSGLRAAEADGPVFAPGCGRGNDASFAQDEEGGVPYGLFVCAVVSGWTGSAVFDLSENREEAEMAEERLGFVGIVVEDRASVGGALPDEAFYYQR